MAAARIIWLLVSLSLLVKPALCGESHHHGFVPGAAHTYETVSVGPLGDVAVAHARGGLAELEAHDLPTDIEGRPVLRREGDDVAGGHGGVGPGHGLHKRQSGMASRRSGAIGALQAASEEAERIIPAIARIHVPDDKVDPLFGATPPPEGGEADNSTDVIARESAATTGTSTTTTAEEADAHSGKKDKGMKEWVKWTIAISSIVVCLGAVGGGAFFFLKPQATEEDDMADFTQEDDVAENNGVEQIDES